MKKATQILVALILSLGIVNLGNVAGAQQLPDCDSIVITNTGPSSNNDGVCTVNVNVTVTCSNNIYALTENSQEAVSGAASSIGNTTAGAAITGDATNENGTLVQVGTSCGNTSGTGTTTPPTTTTPTTSSTPAAPAATPTTARVKKPAMLPYTASSSLGETVAIAVIALGTIALTARFAVTAYRRIALK